MRVRAMLAAAVMTVAAAAGCQDESASKGPQAVVPSDRAELARSTMTSDAVNEGKLELVASFTGAMPTGVTVSRDGRIFVSFPRWGDPVETTCAELKDGTLVPFPDEGMNKLDQGNAASCLVSVQSVVYDAAANAVWLVDAGNINFGRNLDGGPKLVCVDLSTNRVTQTVRFTDDVVKGHSYLNDIRIDRGRGEAGYAYLTDSSTKGENGLIVVDLGTGQSWRKLDKHASVLPEPGFEPTLEGEADQPMKGVTVGADGIALSPDGKTLFYRPLASHHLYSVPTDLMVDRNARGDSVEGAVKDLGDVGFASDGLECDARGRLYLTDYEHHAVRVGEAGEGTFEPRVLVRDARMIWPDTLALGADGSLYVTANQLNRQKQYHGGEDLRKPPYALFRVKTDARPITR